jgi:hypothetical protein
LKVSTRRSGFPVNFKQVSSGVSVDAVHDHQRS